jgi:GntR family transcriptional regulator
MWSDDAARVVMRELRDQRSDGRLQDGAVLPAESQLAASYLVSRPAIRHALRRLAADGLVQRIPGRGTATSPLSFGLTSAGSVQGPAG